MTIKIRFGKDLTLDIRKCQHLLIIGKGGRGSEFATQIKRQFVADCCGTDCNLVSFNESKERQLSKRYKQLCDLNADNIEQFNKHVGKNKMKFCIMVAGTSTKEQMNNALKQILVKGRAVGMHIIMFANNISRLDADLLDLFLVKLVYRVKNADESILLTGYSSAENLKDSEFMLAELGKRPVIYKI